MAGIQGAPAPKPSQLNDPVPGQVEQSELDQFLSSVDAPSMDAQAPSGDVAAAPAAGVVPQEAPSELDAFLGGQSAMAAPEPLSGQPDPRGIESFREQSREAVTRLKNAFTVSNQESLNVLKQSGLFEDVRVGEGGTMEVKRPGRKGFEKFDREKFELVGDTLDLARDAFEAIIEGGTEVLGTFAGVAGGGGVGGAVGNIASGAVGAVAAKNAGDFVQEKVMGIEIDPGRDRVSESKLAAAFGAGFTWLGSQAARRAAKTKLAAKEATTKFERAQAKVLEANEMVKTVNESGIKLDGNKFKLDAQQAIGRGEMPEVETTVQKLLTEDGFQNFRAEQGEVLNDAVDSIAKHIGSQTRGGRELGEDFVLTAMDLRRAEGKLIGDYRKFARAELTGQPLKAPRTAEFMQNAVQDPQLAINPKTGRIAFNPDEAITDLSNAQQKAYVDFLNKAMVPLRKNQGGMNIDAAQDLYEQLSREINRNVNSDRGRAYAYRLIDLKNSVRDDWTDMIGQVLPEDMVGEYATSKAAYSDIMKSFDSLSSELKNADISAEALSNAIFSKGKSGLMKARAAKTLFRERDPRMWQELTGQYINTMFNNAYDGAKGTYNFKKMMGDWSKLGPQMQMEILDGSGIKPEGMSALFKLGTKYQNAKTAFKAEPDDIKNLTQVTLAVVGRVSDIAREQIFSRIFSGMGKDQMVVSWLQDGGMAILEKELKGKMKPGMIKKLSNTVMRMGTSVPVRTGIRRSAEDETK